VPRSSLRDCRFCRSVAPVRSVKPMSGRRRAFLHKTLQSHGTRRRKSVEPVWRATQADGGDGDFESRRNAMKRIWIGSGPPEALLCNRRKPSEIVSSGVVSYQACSRTGSFTRMVIAVSEAVLATAIS
jgi:hypothetical protein